MYRRSRRQACTRRPPEFTLRMRERFECRVVAAEQRRHGRSFHAWRGGHGARAADSVPGARRCRWRYREGEGIERLALAGLVRGAEETADTPAVRHSSARRGPSTPPWPVRLAGRATAPPPLRPRRRLCGDLAQFLARRGLAGFGQGPAVAIRQRRVDGADERQGRAAARAVLHVLLDPGPIGAAVWIESVLRRCSSVGCSITTP